MGIFKEENIQQLTTILKSMVNPVKIIIFTGDSPKNQETLNFMREFVHFSSKLSLVEYDFHKDEEAKKEWGAFDFPAIFITKEDESFKGIVFYGSPSGYTISSFLSSIINVSGVLLESMEESMDEIQEIVKPVTVYVYVSLTCSLFPCAVMNALKLALLNSNVKTCVVDTSAFKSYAEKFDIQALPTITIANTVDRLIGKNAEDFNQLIKLLIQAQ